MWFVFLVIIIFGLYFVCSSKNCDPKPEDLNNTTQREKPLWFKKEDGNILFDKRGNEVNVVSGVPVILNPGNYIVKCEKGIWEVFQVQGKKVRGAKLVKVQVPDILKETLQRKGIFC